jgi:ATP-dependent Clp protease ATP-binding subunit ClpA
MFGRFTGPARAVVTDARAIAYEQRSPTVEAEHLLLAAARRPSPLRAAGLDYETLLGALEAERTRSLAAVGIAIDPPAAAPPVEQPRFATSAKAALERAVRAAAGRRDKRIDDRHVVLGVLSARAGTVPRALEIAGVDRAALLAELSGPG